MSNYTNELLSQSKPEIIKVWNETWEKIQKLNPLEDTTELVRLNKEFDKCVEAYYAVDCGDCWKVNSASRVNGKYKTYKVMKPVGQRQEHFEPQIKGVYVELEK